MADRKYEVGYRRPPAASRFRKGVSGNPSGKRRPQPSLSELLDRILAEKVEVTERGQSRRYSKEEVFLRQMVTRAIGGDRQIARLLLDYMERRQRNEPGQVASHTDEFLMSELRSALTGGHAN